MPVVFDLSGVVGVEVSEVAVGQRVKTGVGVRGVAVG